MELLLHCGAAVVGRDFLAQVKTPDPTNSWSPIDHFDFLRIVENALTKEGLKTGEEAHALTKDNNRYFGVLEVLRTSNALGYSRVLGLRNSHDKSISAGIVAGASVFVCDNLSFSGEVNILRKHTSQLNRDISPLADMAIQQLLEHWDYQDRRIKTYQGFVLNDSQVHDLVIQATDANVCPNRMIPHVLKHWRSPAYSDFEERTAWSLFNGFTQALKGNLTELPSRTIRLHDLFDRHVGLLS